MPKEQRGIQSIEVGGRLLLALLDHGAPMTLKDLAQKAEMPPANAHPYLVSFGKLGLIEQTSGSAAYDLGPLALQLGLASLHRLNPVRFAIPEIVALAARTGQTVALAVWGNRGPTVVHLEESSQPVHVNLRPGTVMSLLNSATGRVFAAYLPPKLTERILNEELREVESEHENALRPSWTYIEETLAKVRSRGMDRAVGHPIPGINALSAPVFAHTHAIVLVITAMGTIGSFDPEWDGAIAKALLDCTEGLSRRLGYMGDSVGKRLSVDGQPAISGHSEASLK
jgi:DNA-binding IclR family transcriptional regulator